MMCILGRKREEEQPKMSNQGSDVCMDAHFPSSHPPPSFFTWLLGDDRTGIRLVISHGGQAPRCTGGGLMLVLALALCSKANGQSGADDQTHRSQGAQ